MFQNLVLSDTHWLKKINLIDNDVGYTQKCASCHWIGIGLRNPVESCPECQGKLEDDEALVLGGTIVFSYGRNIYLEGIHSSAHLPFTPVERADILDIQAFFGRHNERYKG